MKFGVNNLGSIKKASIDVGDLTIICGKNNSGKSYLTYALYSFLHTVAMNLSLPISDKFFNLLVKEGFAVISAKDYWPEKINQEFQNTISHFISFIPKALAIQSSNIKPDIAFEVSIGEDNFKSFIQSKFSMSAQVTEKCRILAEKDANTHNIRFTLKNLGQRLPNKETLKENVIGLFSFCVGKKVIDDVFAISSERTGVFLFAQELHIIIQDYLSKNKKEIEKTLIEDSEEKDTKSVPYPLPIMEEINFASLFKLKMIVKRESFIMKEHPEILKAFDDLVNGQFKVDDYLGIQYIVQDEKVKPLSLSECSSSVKSLVELNFYLRHCARKGQILMIDEPELNLHPYNQRKLARLLAMLVNAGIKLFITTHSDYIVREIDFMTRLFENKKLAQELGYKINQLLDSSRIKSYITQPISDSLQFELKEIKIGKEVGVESTSFDSSIEEMNLIQQAIQFGEVPSNDDFTFIQESSEEHQK